MILFRSKISLRNSHHLKSIIKVIKNYINNYGIFRFHKIKILKLQIKYNVKCQKV